MSSHSAGVDRSPNAAGRHRQRAARGGALNLAGAAVSALASFVLATIVTRGMSPTAAGAFFAATSLFLLTTNVAQIGTGAGLVYAISRARGQGTLANPRTFMRIALGPVLAMTSLLCAALAIWAEPIARAFTRNVVSPEVVGTLRALALFVPAAVIMNLALAGTRGLGTMRYSALYDQLLRTVLQVVGVAGVVLLSIPQWSAAAWGLAYVLVAIPAWLSWRRRSAAAITQSATPQAASRREFWAFSIPRGLAGIAQVAMQRLDVLLVGALAGLVPAAVYAAASRFLSLGLLANGAISQAVQPLLGEALGRKDTATTRDLYRTATGWLVLGAWPVYLGLLTFPDAALQLFGPTYTQGRTALMILAATMMIGTGCGMVSMVLTMAGKTSWNLANALVSLGLMIGVDLVAIPRLGITGAAVGWSAAILAANLIPLTQVACHLRLHPFGRGPLAAMGLSLVFTGLLPWALSRLLGTGPSSALTCVGIGLVVYLVALVATRRVTHLDELLAAIGSRRSKRAKDATAATPDPSEPEGPH